MNTQLIVNIFSCFAEGYFFYLMFEALLRHREGIKSGFYAANIAVMSLLILASNGWFSYSLLNMLVIAVIGLLGSLLYGGKPGKRLFAVFLNLALVSLIEVGVLYAMCAAFGVNGSMAVEDGMLRIFGVLSSKLLCFLAVKFITVRIRKNIVGYETSFWLLFVILFTITVVTIYTLWKILEHNADAKLSALATVSAVGLGVSTVIVMVLFENSIRQKTIINQKQASEDVLKEQIKHYKGMMRTQWEIRKMKHDLRNHLFGIKAYMKSGDIDAGLGYVDNLLENTNGNGSYIHTGNTVLDALISEKKTDAENRGIRFTSRIMIPQNLPISPEDVCIIFGNALDNAIEGAERGESEKYVDMELLFKKGTVYCNITNSCPNDVGEGTTKPDKENHGIGRYSIRDALEKYNYSQDVVVENGEYILSIIFMGLSSDFT